MCKRNLLGICKRNSPDKEEEEEEEEEEEKEKEEEEKKKEKKSQLGMCKRNSLHRNQDSTGCVRKTHRIKVKAARDV